MPIPNSGYGISGYGQGGFGNSPVEFEPIGFYLALLTSEYQYPNSPKLRALLYLLLRKFQDVSACLVQMDFYQDLDNAVGPMLDQKGAIAGVSRTVDFQPSNGVSPILDDNTYRILIKAQIGRNQWNGTIGGLQALWAQLFPNGTIIIADQQNMTADIILSGSFTSIIQDLITNDYIIPRTEGVLYTFSFVELPIFGADLDNTFIAGADQGHAA